MKILTVVGARPQFVKAAALSRVLKEQGQFEEIIVHTGQHFDAKMSDVFFDEMQIPKPKYNLHINSLGHGAMTGRMLEGIEQILLDEKPDLLLVYGDTNSTIAGALAAKKLHIKVGHVEAGLRSFNMKMPEEVNRILTDRISDVLFCPTQTAVNNLKNEGYEHFDATIHLSGDVMQDAALHYAQFSSSISDVISRLGNPSSFYLATIHRAENTDEPKRLQGIINALNALNKENKVICPLHPRTKKKIEATGIETSFEIIEPVGYFDMIELLKGSELVLTDSGGLQKEAYFFSKPCVTMRDQTEWTELVDHNFNVIVGAEEERIVEGVQKMLSAQHDFSLDLYGGGQAAINIANALSSMA